MMKILRIISLNDLIFLVEHFVIQFNSFYLIKVTALFSYYSNFKFKTSNAKYFGVKLYWTVIDISEDYPLSLLRGKYL